MLSQLRKIPPAYVSTMVAEFGVLLAGIWVYRLASLQFGEQGFDEYAMCRRSISFLQPLLILGFGVGIPRFVAFSMADKKYASPGSYFYSGLTLSLSFAFLVLGTLFVFSDTAAFFLFGSSDFAYLITPVLLMILALVFHGLVYGFFRGSMRTFQANTFQFLNLGLVPILAFYYSEHIVELLYFTGLAWMSISLFFLFQIFISHPPVFSRDRKPAKELFNYGIRRVPGDFALAGFMALPALLTAHLVSDNLSTAGDVAFSVSLVNMAGAAFGPICLLLLPKASTAFAQNNTGGLLKEVKIITWFTALSSLVGILIVQIFAEELLTLYLGSYPSSLPEIVRWVVPGILGFGVYVSLRSVLDAYYIKAVNTSNIILTSVVFLFISGATFFMKLDFMYILYGFLFSVFLLGFLTLRQTFQLLTGKGTT